MKIKEIIKRPNYYFRAVIIIIALFPLLFIKEFYNHFYAYMTGNIINRIITEQWHIVLINIVLFTAFVIPLTYRKKANWTQKGLVTAFFVSLFVEMYGIPFTILFASKFFAANTNLPDSVINFSLLGVGFGMDLAMLYGTVLITIGTLLIVLGWITLYRNIKSNKLVTNGVYSFSRHPQYLGFLLIIIGWFIGWPTFLTLIFSPILIYFYVRTAKKEEREAGASEEYEKYKKRVPFFV